MIPWIQVYSNLPQHPKTSRLADELSLSCSTVGANAMAAGLLVCLWTWAVQNACDGDLSKCSPRSIAEACQWKKSPDVLLRALTDSGWIDSDMKLHDWEEYASLLMEQEENRKAKTRDRVKRYRDRKLQYSDRDCNVTETLRNASTVPNPTLPYHTIPEILSGGGGDTRTRAREEVEGYLRERGLDPTAYFGLTEEELLSVRALTAEAFSAFAARTPTRMDEVRTFIALRETSRDMLLYAFEAANCAGKPGEWPYINGVLEKTKRRKIGTISEAEGFDFERKDKDGDRL